MGNKITRFLSSETGKKVSNIDFLNSIREMATPAYQADIPVLTERINHATVPVQQFQVHENEFFNALVNRIGTVVIKALSYENPLSIFKSETFEFGDVLQEIYVHPAQAEDFDGKSSVSPFKFSDTDIEVFFHKLNNEKIYTRTFERAWVQKAFTSDIAFDEFIDKMFTSLLSSDSLDEYQAVKTVLENALEEVSYTDLQGNNKKITVQGTKIDTTVSDYVVDFNQALLNKSKEFTIPSRSRFNNPVGVPNTTPLDNQWLVISSEWSTHLDMLLANAFNMDKASVQARQIVVDNFDKFTGAGVNNGLTPVAFLVSDKSIILKDKLTHMENIRNPRTLSYNYFYHHHYMTSLSLFENIHMFYIED